MRACVRVFVCRCVHVHVCGMVYIAHTHMVIKFGLGYNQSSIEIGLWRDVYGTLFLSPPPLLRFLDLSRFLPFSALSVCNSAYLFLFCHHYGSQARACVLVFCLKDRRALSSCISSALSCCISTVHTHAQWYFFVVTQDIIIITGDIIMITVIIIITKTLCQGDQFVRNLYLWFWYHLNFVEILKELPFKYPLFWKINTWDKSSKKTGNTLSCSLLMYPPQKKWPSPRAAARGIAMRAVKVLTSHHILPEPLYTSSQPVSKPSFYKSGQLFHFVMWRMSWQAGHMVRRSGGWWLWRISRASVGERPFVLGLARGRQPASF